jgi:hypothetical protein
LCKPLLQRLPIQQLHGDKGLALVLADFVNGADVRVFERGGGAGFAMKALQRLPIARKLFGQKLQCDLAVKLSVFGLVDDTHASATEFFQDAIVGNGLTDGDHGSATSPCAMNGTSGGHRVRPVTAQVNTSGLSERVQGHCL